MGLEAVIGANVRRLRKARGLSQEALAPKAGIDMRYLGSIERGEANPTIGVLADLAKVLGVHPSILLIEGRPKT
jgi:transcriptional regulator with XRE-family HTH domain